MSTEVTRRELAWHEQEAHRRIRLDALLYDPPAFDAVVEAALDYLQPQPGETVLEMGCGEGKEVAMLAERGYTVIAVDLSAAQLARARKHLAERCPGVAAHFVQASAEQLPFAEGAFRVIYGKAILHHLEIDAAAGEVQRLLKPSGRAAFAEPMAQHPLFRFGRLVTPRLRTQDEHPLTWAELQRFAGAFAESQTGEHFLLAPLVYLVRAWPGGEALFRRLHRALQRADAWLFARSARLRRAAWYGRVVVRK